ncbi:MAG TPA: hypothetical protein VFH51_11625 [Myxococcota bacterium]|nr:hypothetical protein [Myxococcota bacterium]
MIQAILAGCTGGVTFVLGRALDRYLEGQVRRQRLGAAAIAEALGTLSAFATVKASLLKNAPHTEQACSLEGLRAINAGFVLCDNYISTRGDN